MMMTPNRRYSLEELYQPIVRFFDKFDSPKWEALKLVGRLLLMLFVSSFLAQTLEQANLLPERWYVKVLIFTYTIPVRYLFITGLTLVQTFVDRYKYLNNKAKKIRGVKATGLYPL